MTDKKTFIKNAIIFILALLLLIISTPIVGGVE